jgi:hypothetical protein
VFVPVYRYEGLEPLLAELAEKVIVPSEEKVLLEQPEPFAANAIFEQAKTGHIAARFCQASNESGADRINNIHKHDWDRSGCLK